jgi:hypothetical protein
VGNRIELPSGGWVELKDDLDDIRAGTRKRLLKEAGFGQDSDNIDNIDKAFGLGGAVAHFAVERYQLDYKPFSSAVRVNMASEDWDELRMADQDALIIALQSIVHQLLPDQPTPDNMRPGSPTPPAGE